MKSAKILIQQTEIRFKLYFLQKGKEPIFIGAYNFIDFENYASFQLNDKYNLVIWFNSLFKYTNKILGQTRLYFNVSYSIYSRDKREKVDLTILRALNV